MKQFKDELELLKKVKANTSNDAHGGIGHDIKNSYINRMYMKSSLMSLWVFSWIVFLFNKIPMIKYLIGLLSIWYGKTTWWKILGRILSVTRKTFVVFNALIGIYVIYNLCGFEVGLMFSHFATMGHTYLEILFGFTKRIFEWFLDFLGYDLGPRKPNIPTGHIRNFWNIGDIPKMPDYNYGSGNSLRDSYKSLLNINVDPISTPWYKDLTTWLWIGGIVSFVGLSYLGYKFVMDPYFFSNDITPTIRRPRGDIPPYYPDNGDPGIIESIGKGLKSVGSKVISGFKILNPYSWFTSATDMEELAKTFNKVQCSDNYDNRYYPFTPYHPYDSWFTNLKLSIFGENPGEKAIRYRMKHQIMKNLWPVNTNSPNIPLTELPPVSPHIGSIGLGTRYTSGTGLYEKIDATTSAAIVSEKLASLSTTPSFTPSNLPPISDIDNEINTVWEGHQQMFGGFDERKWRKDKGEYSYRDMVYFSKYNK